MSTFDSVTSRAVARALLSIVAFWTLLVWAGVSSFAAEGQVSPAVGSFTTGQQPVVREDVRSRIEAVTADPSLDSDARERALADYRSALESLDRVDSFEADIKDSVALRDRAPQTVAVLRKELDEFAPPPTLVDAKMMTLPDVTAALALAESDLAAARARLADVQKKQAARSERRSRLPEMRSSAQRLLSEIPDHSLGDIQHSNEPERAKRAAQWTRRFALEKEIAAYAAELAAYDAARDIASLRIAIAEREVSDAALKVEALQNLASDRRAAEAEAAERKAALAQLQIAGTDPALRAIADATADFAGRRTGPAGVGAKIAATELELSSVESELDRISGQVAEIHQRIDAVGFNEAVGLLLRKARAQLPSRNAYWRAIRTRRSEMGRVQVELLQLEDRRTSLQSLDDELDALVDEHAGFEDEREEREFRRDARDLLETQREYVSDLIGDYDRYFEALADLDARQRELVAQTEEQRDFIDERVLWIRSTSAVGWSTFSNALDAMKWLFAPDDAKRLRNALVEGFYEAPVEALFWGLLLVLFVAGRSRLRRTLLASVQSADAPISERYSMRPIAKAALTTLVLALQIPAIFYYLAWVLTHSSGMYAGAVAAGVRAAGDAVLLVELVRQTCRDGGLGIAHLGWPKNGTMSLQRHFAVAAFFAVPAVFVVSAIQSQPNEAWQVSLGRLAFMATAIIVTLLANSVLKPSGPLIQDLVAHDRVPWLRKLQNFVYLAATLPNIVILFLAATGFYFLAISLAPIFGATIRFALLLVVINSVILRWMLFARRRLAIQRALARRKQKVESGKSESTAKSDLDGEILAAASRASEIGLAEISEQNRRLLRGAFLLSFGIGVSYIWRDVLPAFRVFDTIELWTVAVSSTEQITVDGLQQAREVTRSVPITLGSVLMSALIIAVTFSASRNLPGFLELAVLQRLPFDAGQRYAVTAVSKYLIVTIGVVAAFGSIGVSWSQVQWLIAAMTVGLGFGLQEIFANFISGIIILLERPIRVGDTVTLGDLTGRVCRIQSRATTILDWDRKELIVPNKDFITDQLINWSLSDPILRLTIPVGIAYGSDTALAEKVLLEVAAKNEFVLAEPPSQVVFNAFGDSSLAFQLRVFIASIETFWRAQHSLHMQIDQAFRDRGIEISFPQRDVHVRSVSSSIPLTVEPRS